jgi:hydroxyacylglutathione hydrolase
MEIVPGIHQVDGVNGNCYIISREGLTIIDTGLPGSARKILSYITDVLHRDPKEIRTIVLTHFHTDHIGGVPGLKNAAPDLKVAIHAADAGYVSGTAPMPRYGGIMGAMLKFFTTVRPTRFVPDIALSEGSRIDGLTCVHLPGHTPGSTGLFDEATGTLFAGDVLRTDGTNITDGPTGFTMDLAESRNSIRKIAGLSFSTLLIGHGSPLVVDAHARVEGFASSLPH